MKRNGKKESLKRRWRLRKGSLSFFQANLPQELLDHKSLQLRLFHPPGGNFINILQAVFAPISFCQKVTKPTVIRKKLRNLHSNEKCLHKMLMKLTQGGNFINMFTQSLYAHRSQKRKKTVKSLMSFCAFRILPTIYKHLFVQKCFAQFKSTHSLAL